MKVSDFILCNCQFRKDSGIMRLSQSYKLYGIMFRLIYLTKLYLFTVGKGGFMCRNYSIQGWIFSSTHDIFKYALRIYRVCRLQTTNFGQQCWKPAWDWISSSVKRYFSIDFEYWTVSTNAKYTSETLQMTFDLISSLNELDQNRWTKFRSNVHYVMPLEQSGRRVQQITDLSNLSGKASTWCCPLRWKRFDLKHFKIIFVVLPDSSPPEHKLH